MKKFLLFFLILAILCLSGCSRSYFQGDFETVATDLAFPEGPTWFRGQLAFSNCYGAWVGAIRNGQVDTLLRREDGIKKTNGTVYDTKGNLYICEYADGKILKYSVFGRLTTLRSKDNLGRRFNRPNDICISRDGFLYFTDPRSYNDSISDGRVFKLDTRSGDLSLVADGLQFPNGLTLSPDESILYIGESVNKNILRYNMNTHRIDTLVTLPQGKQDPDGMVCDRDGNLYVAYYGGGMIYVISPEGQILDSLPVPGKKPSNVEFGNNERNFLYVTECETHSIYRIKTKHIGY